MKKYIIILSMLFAFGLIAEAQTPRHINLELLGAYNMVGFSFDSRFSENSRFGYRVGIGYGFSISKSFFSYSRGHYVSVPLNAYYLFGKKSHHFETGLGVFPIYGNLYSETEFEFYPDYDSHGSYNNGIGYSCFGRLAYRFESASKPLSVSAGIDVPFKTPYSFFEKAIIILPSISIGYRLK